MYNLERSNSHSEEVLQTKLWNLLEDYRWFVVTNVHQAMKIDKSGDSKAFFHLY